MRIAYVVHQFFPEFGSGTERVTMNLARAAQRAGHRVEVLACQVDETRAAGALHPQIPGARRLVHEGVPVSLLPRAELPLHADTTLDVHEPWVDPLARWFGEQRVDVAHLMHAMRTSSAIEAARRAGVPYLTTLTDFHVACLRINLVDLDGRPCAGPEEGRACARKCPAPGWPETALRARHQAAAALLAGAAARVAPSEFVAARFRDAFPGLAFEVLPHGVDLLALMRGRAANAADRPADGVRRVVFLGTAIPVKGLHVLLRALALLPGRPVELHAAGTFHHDRGYETEVRALAAADPRVHLAGQLDAAGVSALLASADLLCLPSLVPESYSLVTHEAAAFGVPSLVSDRGAPAEAVRRHGGGGVVDGDRPEDWARAIDRWLSDERLSAAWRAAVRMPQRIEEEAFLYESMYRQAAAR